MPPCHVVMAEFLYMWSIFSFVFVVVFGYARGRHGAKQRQCRLTASLSGWDAVSGTRAGMACTAHAEGGAVCKYNVYSGMHTLE